MNSIIGMVCLVLGGVALAAGVARHQEQATTAKADKQEVRLVGTGESTIPKRPWKMQERLSEFQCPAGARDVMDAAGDIIGCQKRR